MIECFVNRNTKELLVSLKFEGNPECKGNCHNTEFDAIRFEDDELENKITKKDGKTYLNFEYVK